MTTHDRRTDGFLLGFFTALIGSSSIPTEKCEVCTCAIYHSPQIIEAEGPLGVDIYNFIKALKNSGQKIKLSHLMMPIFQSQTDWNEHTKSQDKEGVLDLLKSFQTESSVLF